MKRSVVMRRVAVTLTMVLVGAIEAFAQFSVDDAAIAARWKEVLGEAITEQQRQGTPNALLGTPEERAAVYADAIDRLFATPVPGLASLDETAIQDRVRDSDRVWIRRLRESGAESRAPIAADSRSTNPVTQGLAERSGFSDLLALALNARNVVSADATAVSINLNALAVVSLADPEVFSELYRYQQHGFARRFGGTITLGAKIPEKEITGHSGFPEFDKLADATGWDVKVRVLGDKDPRSAKWYPMTLGRGGDINQINAVVAGLVPVADAPLVQQLVKAHLGAWLADLKARIARSPQLTLKVAGTHLQKEPGKNKYSGALLFDVGVGVTDLTANLTYTATNDVRFGADKLFTIKRYDFSAQVTSHLAPGAFAPGRTVDWSVGSSGTVFTDKGALPIATQNTWKLYSNVEVPVGNAARIPFSVIYSNDPNALTKSKFVSGFVGVSYDFSAIGRLFGST